MDARYLESTLNVKGRDIYCKIRINPQAPTTYLLLLPDLPGYDHQASLPLAERLIAEAARQQITMPSIIMFDFPGCGRSDKAKNPNEEYTINNFAEVTAFVIEHIRLRVCPANYSMNLKIYCESFGSLIAMSLVPRRPKWLRHDSNIRLTQIISNGGICGMRNEDYAKDFIFRRYFHHPAYEALHKALTKLFNGDIKDIDDYISEIALPLAPLFSHAYADLPNSALGSVLRERPSVGATLLRAARYIGNLLGKDVTAVNDNLHHFNGVSIDVMKRFFATRFNGVNVQQMVADNTALYSAVSLLIIAGNQDCFMDFVAALSVKQQLNSSSAVIILNDKHLRLTAPEHNAVEEVVLRSVTNRLKKEDLVAPIFNYSNFPERTPSVNRTRAKIFKCSTRMINLVTGEVTHQSTTEVSVGDAAANIDTTNPQKIPKQPQQVMSTDSYQPITDDTEAIVIKKKRV